jgi:endonuclease/exonuclease/phosphatase family metal-dependent hydrolase
MNYRLIISILLCSSGCSFAQYTNKIKVMTYNINAETKSSATAYSSIADVIKTINPDITGLQKVDSCNSRNSADVLKWLGEQTSRTPTFAPAMKNYQGSTGSYGVGFLTKENPLSTRRLWIEHTSSEQDRGVIELGITMAGEKVRVIVTHLAHEGLAYRTAQLNKIIPWIDSLGTTDPVIIMADFNAAPTESSMKLLETAGFSYVKGKNDKILDTSASQGINHILFRPATRWTVVDAGNPSYPNASNRNPVWADMELTGTSNTALFSKSPAQHAAMYLENGILRYVLKNGSNVSLSLYNAAGMHVRSLLNRKYQLPGSHAFSMNGIKLPNGLYYCILSTTTEQIIEKVILFK